MPEPAHTKHILLADDDSDDLTFFQEALDELSLPVKLTIVHNGEKLMLFLRAVKGRLPDVLFLDLNMPRKSGFECLSEIKTDKELQKLPVIIFTTSNEPSLITLLYKAGAQFYIRKPNKFEHFKKIIRLALQLSEKSGSSQTSRSNFVLSSQFVKDEH